MPVVTSIYLPNGIRILDRSSTTSLGLSVSLPVPANSSRAAPPWCWPVTTTNEGSLRRQD